MAFGAYLHESSGDGDEIGVNTSLATLVYVSEVNDLTKEDPTEPVRELMPLGEPHPVPTAFPGMEAQRYVKHRTDNQFVWFVEVVFGYPDAFGFAGWTVNVNLGGTTERIGVDRKGKIIGPFAYDVFEPEQGTDPNYMTHTLRGPVALRRPDRDPAPKKQETIDEYRRASTLVLTRTLFGLTAKRIRQAEAFVDNFNKYKFIAWPSPELLVTNVTIRETPANPEQVQSGRLVGRFPLIYPAEIHFRTAPVNDDQDGWKSVTRIDKYTDAEGNTSTVMERVAGEEGEEDTERPVTQKFFRHEEADFGQLFAILEGGPIRGGRP